MLDRDTIRIAVIAIVAVALARMFIPRLPVIGATVGPYL